MSQVLVGSWLLSTSAGLFGLVMYGGYTRLKRAGLSMVDWRPHSIKLPKDEVQWEAEFSRYKTFPEYEQNNSDMTLEEFKDIYHIEWTHRVWARGIGAYFAIPMGIFWWKGALTPFLKKHCVGMLALGAMQGCIGWWMVKSGLESPPEEGRVRVSQVRLAAHQITGIGLYSWVFSVGLRCFLKPPEELLTTQALLKGSLWLRKRGIFLTHLAALSMFCGALVAGSDSGKVKSLIPDEIFDREPWYRNFYENKGMMMLNHSLLGLLTFCSATDTWLLARQAVLLTPSRVAVHFMMGSVSLQVLLGLTAVYRGCPLYESLAHQGNGLAFLTSTLALIALTRKPPRAYIQSFTK
jgi:cytochrome c oxidase assembly protein subunit 15